MKRNWILICTAKNKENKVVDSLSKKGFTSYCPSTNVVKKVSGSKKITAKQPLFAGFVFVLADRSQSAEILKVAGVANMMYWKAAPVSITEEEMSGIKMIAETYSSLDVERIAVCPSERMNIVEESFTGKENDVLVITHKGLTVTLPVLGYKLTAKRESKPVFAPAKVTAKRKSFAQMISPLFFFNF